MKSKKLVVFGDGINAQMAYEYFTHDSPYEVVAFCVNADYRREDRLFSLPVEVFEDIEKKYAPAEYDFFVAVGETALNRFRARLCRQAKAKGYRLTRYVSTEAFVWHNVKIGENCFILSNSIVQPFAEIGDNVIVWNGTDIGHHTKIGDNCFLATAMIAGLCEVGDNSFLGSGALIANGVKIGKDNYIAMGAVISKDTKENSVYRGNPAKRVDMTAKFFCGVED